MASSNLILHPFNGEFEFGIPEIQTRDVVTAMLFVIQFIILFSMFLSNKKRIEVLEDRFRRIDDAFSFREAIGELKVWLKATYQIKIGPKSDQENDIRTKASRDGITTFKHQLEKDRELSVDHALKYVEILGEKEEQANWFAHRARPKLPAGMGVFPDTVAKEAGI